MASITRNNWLVRNTTPTRMKKNVQPVMRNSSFIELLFDYQYNSNKRFCQEKLEQKFDCKK